jgi:putative hemolysin
MEDFIGYRLLLLVLIIAANAFFASAEVALLSVRMTRLREMAEAGVLGAQAAINLRANPQRLLSVVQVGVTLASLGAGWAGEEAVHNVLIGAASPYLPENVLPAMRVVSFILSFLLLTFAMVVIGEVVPKNIAIQKADRLAVLVAPVLLVAYRVLEPFVYLLERASALLSRLLRVPEEQRGSYSPEELKVIIDSSRNSGYLPDFDADMMHRVLEMEDLAVREIMVPRNEIVSVADTASIDQILRVMIEYKYTRVPVYQGSRENIIGVLHYKDLLREWEHWRVSEQVGRPLRPFELRRILRKTVVVPETKPITQMVEEFRRAHTHLALVVDEFGTISGLVTLEDVLEQVVGEIEDEHDVRRHTVHMRADVLEIDGTISIRDLDMHYGIELPAGAGFETLAGFILHRLGHIPKPGESVTWEGREFTVLEMERKRISRVRIDKTASTGEQNGDGNGDEDEDQGSEEEDF